MPTRPGWLMSTADSWSRFPVPATPGRTTTTSGSKSSLKARWRDRPRSRSRHRVVRLRHGAAGRERGRPEGRTFPYLGASRIAGAAVRVGAHLPWRVLRRVYAQIGASEGVRPEQLGRVDLRAVARLLTEDYPCRRYPAVMIGSSNGALLHLAAAMQVPWLPGTVLVPVKRTCDPQRPFDAMRFGESVADRLLDRNKEVVLHHMHDQVQDQLMVARINNIRTKWRH